MKYITVPLIAITTLFTACNKSNDEVANMVQDQSVRVVSELRGNKALPPNSSPATGILRADLNSSAGVLIYTLDIENLTQMPASIHIHEAAETQVGPVVFDLGVITASPRNGTISLTKEQSEGILSGKYYIDVHNNSFLEGEIRGQIVKGTPVEIN